MATDAWQATWAAAAACDHVADSLAHPRGRRCHIVHGLNVPGCRHALLFTPTWARIFRVKKIRSGDPQTAYLRLHVVGQAGGHSSFLSHWPQPTERRPSPSECAPGIGALSEVTARRRTGSTRVDATRRATTRVHRTCAAVFYYNQHTRGIRNSAVGERRAIRCPRRYRLLRGR
jgi:hypothetical protein